MTSAAAFSLDRPQQSLAVVELERPLVVPAAANDRRATLLSEFARAMRQVEIEVYGID